MSDKFNWAFTNYGYKFLASHQYKFEENLATNEDTFSTLTNNSEPLSYVLKDYRKDLLEKALQCLCGAGHVKNETPTAVKQVKTVDATPNLSTSQISDVLNYTELLNGNNI